MAQCNVGLLYTEMVPQFRLYLSVATMKTQKIVILFCIFSMSTVQSSSIVTVLQIKLKNETDLKTVLNIPPPFSGSEKVKYETHEELMDKLNNLAAKFPSLAVTSSIGLSVQSRDLRYIKITKDADQERSSLKPMVKYISNIHGDETVGRQMLQYLAQDILHNYNNGDPFTQFLVNNTELYLLPDMNPDGFIKSTPGPMPSPRSSFSCPHTTPGRVNANGKDLNRDFPSTWIDRKLKKTWAEISVGRQPETVAIMNWTFSQPFVLSANFHSGALVASYAYDTLRPGEKGERRRGMPSETPDEKLFRKLALIYSENNIDMYNQRQEDINQQYRLHRCSNGYGGPFPYGVTNGAAWYNLNGGMQDFNYAYTNCMEITLELSCCKYPPPSLLEEYWKTNRESLLYYMNSVHMGVKGLVRDVQGQPIGKATITVKGNRKTVTTSDRGEYWRLLLPGNYSLTASAVDYHPSTKSIYIPVPNVDSWYKTAKIQHFELKKKNIRTVKPTQNSYSKPKVPELNPLNFDHQHIENEGFQNNQNEGIQNNQNKGFQNNQNEGIQNNQDESIESNKHKRNQNERRYRCNCKILRPKCKCPRRKRNRNLRE